MFAIMKRDPENREDGTTIASSTAEILLDGMSRSERRYVLKSLNESVRRIGAKQTKAARPGAGYPIDRTLRTMVSNLNRFARIYQRPDVLPVGWHMYQPFTELVDVGEGVPAIRTKPEIDHLFDMDDFLAHVRSPDGSGALRSDALLIEGPVRNFTLMGDPLPHVVDDGVGGVFGLSGFSMVREGDEVFWIMVGAYVLDEDDWDAAVEEGSSPMVSTWVDFGDDVVRRTDSIVRGRPTPFEGVKSQKTVFMGSWDPATGIHTRRARLVEWENLFDLVCDDPEEFGCDGEAVASLEDRTRRTMDGLEPIWAVAETMLGLPAYYDFRIPYVTPSAVSGGRPLPVQPDDPEAGYVGMRDPFQVVRCLVPIRDGTHVPSNRDYTAPSHRVEVTGYWRPLAPDSVGRDPSGNPVLGQTWVRSHDRHRDKPEKQHRILVKASIAQAREKAVLLAETDPRRR